MVSVLLRYVRDSLLTFFSMQRRYSANFRHCFRGLFCCSIQSYPTCVPRNVFYVTRNIMILKVFRNSICSERWYFDPFRICLRTLTSSRKIPTRRNEKKDTCWDHWQQRLWIQAMIATDTIEEMKATLVLFKQFFFKVLLACVLSMIDDSFTSREFCDAWLHMVCKVELLNFEFRSCQT